MCGRGMGKEMQRKGSNVLLCFWQCGQVSDDLLERRKKNLTFVAETYCNTTLHFSRTFRLTDTELETAPVQMTQQRAEETGPPGSGRLLQLVAERTNTTHFMLTGKDDMSVSW